MRKIKKNLKWIVPILLLVIGIAIPNISAYFTDSNDAANTFIVGGVNVEIVEDFEPPVRLEPGTVVQKDVAVKNLGPSECYVRVKAVFENSHMEQYCEINWNGTEGVDWIYNSEDGYWYYPESLSVEEITASLFTTITIASDAPVSEIIDFNIIVYTEGVEVHQGGGFADYAQAWDNYQKNKTSN